MITLALTHYNRFNWLHEAFRDVLDHPAIEEIVISDDASTDGSWEQLSEKYCGHYKVKIFTNRRNVDCYVNKLKAVQRSTSDWVILFDSDNVLSVDYIEHLLAKQPWDKHSAYLPVYAAPNFDYRAFGGLVVTRQNVASLLGKKNFLTALNTANYFFNRDEYLRVWDSSVEPHTADSIYQNYRWLEAGNSLVFVSGLTYLHRVHPQSHYKLNHRKTGYFAKEVEQKLRNLR